MSEYAPILLFVYNRPVHTLKVLKAIQKNKLADQSRLYIFSDKEEENSPPIKKKLVEEVREIIRIEQWCREVIILEQEKHLGLSQSIISGIDYVMDKFEAAIILEDDILVMPYFLQYMNDALQLYKDEKKVVSIGSNNYFSYGHQKNTFFLRQTDCWGWATWKDRWEEFEKDGLKLLEELRSNNLIYKFNAENAYPYEKMLLDQIEGRVDSWAIRWYANAILKDRLTLYPSSSMSYNFGFDGTGTHGSSDLNNIYKPKRFYEKEIQLKKIEPFESESGIRSFKKFTTNLDKKTSYYRKIVGKINQILKNLQKHFSNSILK